MPSSELQVKRRARLAEARLYFVCPERGEAAEARLPALVHAAVAGGADVVQLREKELDEDRLIAAARALAPVCDQGGALLIVNDSPLAAFEAGADGVHVGQDDTAPAAARELVGPELLIGLSTHKPAEIDAAEGAPVDYIAVGPVHETPTKPGRPAVGIELVRYAAQHARAPFFAIGGLHADNLAPVLQAGARRAVVLRAIADASDPEAAARELRGRLDAYALDA